MINLRVDGINDLTANRNTGELELSLDISLPDLMRQLLEDEETSDVLKEIDDDVIRKYAEENLQMIQDDSDED